MLWRDYRTARGSGAEGGTLWGPGGKGFSLRMELTFFLGRSARKWKRKINFEVLPLLVCVLLMQWRHRLFVYLCTREFSVGFEYFQATFFWWCFYGRQNKVRWTTKRLFFSAFRRMSVTYSVYLLYKFMVL